jgi:polysaccharide export outer membrane protein
MTFPSYPAHPARLIIVAVVAFGVAAAGAKGQGTSSRPAKVLPQQNSTATNSSSTSTSTSVNANSSYVIGPGDLLAINVLHEPEVSQKVPVRMDGKITMPLIGEIQASGMVPANLQETIAAKLHDYIKDAEVTVVVEEIKSRQFTVMGEVEHPGSFPLVKPTTVLDGLAQAGAFRDFAKLTKIHVLRKTPEGTTISLPFNYKQVSKGRNESENIQLQAGDTIIVP